MLLNKSQNQHYSFSLALSLNCFFHPQFIPHHGTDLSFSRTHGHLHSALLQHYYFQTPALGTKGFPQGFDEVWGDTITQQGHQEGSHVCLDSMSHALVGFRVKRWFLLSCVKLQTVPLWSLWTNTLLSLCMFPASVQDWELFCSKPQPGPGNGREGRGGKKKSEGGGQNQFYFFFFFF